MPRRRGHWAIAAITALLSGCAVQEMILIDPQFDLQTLVGPKVLVMPTRSLVPVPSDVPAEATAALAEHLGRIQGLAILAPSSDSVTLPENDPKAEQINRLATDQHVDVVVTSGITEYWERELREFAQRHSLFAWDALAPTSSWAERPRAEIVLRASIRVYAGATGRLLWQRETLGSDTAEASQAEGGAVAHRLHHQVCQQIGQQVVGDLYPYFSYQTLKP